MTFNSPLKFNEQGYSQIIYSIDKKKRYRIIKNPSFWTKLYYFTFDNDYIHVKLYLWDRKIKDLDY